MLQKGSPATAEFLRSAEDELDKWGVRERVRIKVTDGSLEAVKNERFDIVFTKSVLWSIPDLDTFLDDMECSLAEHGKVAFVENMHGGPAVMWMRRKLRPGFTYENRYFGIQRRQLPYFRERFDDVKISLHRFTVYTILGSKSSRFGQTGRPSAEPTEELELEYRLR